MNFVFYDLETTGISSAFDQPLQFSAILADESLAEIDRIDRRCRLAPHIIPSPQALAVTGVRPSELERADLPDYFEFSREIADLVRRWAPAIWVGYNSMRFDEEFLRQAFFQNLLPDVYATQFNGNTRLDMLTTAHAVHALRPDALEWPLDDDGNPTFRLDRLAPANGLDAHDAHDALGDVVATLHIARLVAGRAPDIWSEMRGNAFKAGVQDKLEGFSPLGLVRRFGAGPPHIRVGCLCGFGEDIPTRAGFLDFDAGDPEALIGADDIAVEEAIAARPSVISVVATNKAPALFEIPDPSDAHLRAATAVMDAPAFRSRVARLLPGARPVDPDAPVERRIYDGFASRDDKRLLEEFHAGNCGWPRRQEIAEELSDIRLKRLGRRLVAFYSPDLLSEAQRRRLREYLRDKWLPPESKEVEWTTVASARAGIAQLKEEGGCDADLLGEIASFVDAKEAEVAG